MAGLSPVCGDELAAAPDARCATGGAQGRGARCQRCACLLLAVRQLPLAHGCQRVAAAQRSLRAVVGRSAQQLVGRQFAEIEVGKRRRPFVA
ncbi:hypothetical protein [Massilia sp. Se16.2.3]|uniref:hypothetical protein n=1 Tax=Massilia sp. Se16.2.3 TaxID=2709303 RepID=UPI00160307BE|nr:hypothetical protein [Massilia sp. Se16.2.3]QNA97665.1 hypothetical protein G4G31_00655 [Massilia sp. Se16.2.3]